MLNNKNILVTGGTGSFGKKFIEMTFKKFSPNKIIVYSRDEFKQDVLKKDISMKTPEILPNIRFFIGDVRDKERLSRRDETGSRVRV